MKMVYTLGQFAGNLESELKSNQRLRDANIQSEKALVLLNELLPRNMMVKRLFLEEKEADSILDVRR
jgi:hypothetical protein